MSLSRLIARPLIGVGIAYLAQGTLRNPGPAVPAAKRVTDRVVPMAQDAGVPLPDDTATLVRINAGAQLGGALLVGTGRAPRLGAAVIAGSLVPTTIAGHPFWNVSDPDQRKVQALQFFKNLALLGGLIIAAGDTDGKPGLPWRARRAAKDAKREARTAARIAKAKVS